MNTAAWRKEIRGAENSQDVLDIVERFVEALDGVELLELPENCRPSRIASTQEVGLWAFKLASASLAPGQPAPLREISLVFAEAASRIAELALGRRPRTISKVDNSDFEPQA